MAFTGVLILVEVLTTDGSIYKFPDMAQSILDHAASRPSDGNSSLLLVNASGATLTVPWRIVEKVWTHEKILWKRPSLA